jgi:hypothetical protein
MPCTRGCCIETFRPSRPTDLFSIRREGGATRSLSLQPRIDDGNSINQGRARLRCLSHHRHAPHTHKERERERKTEIQGGRERGREGGRERAHEASYSNASSLNEVSSLNANRQSRSTSLKNVPERPAPRSEKRTFVKTDAPVMIQTDQQACHPSFKTV